MLTLLSNTYSANIVASIVLDFEKPIVELEQKIQEMKSLTDTLDIQPQITVLEDQVEKLRLEVYQNLTRWQRVQIARHPERPYTLDYASHCFTDFIQLHGDRGFRDDPAIIGGMATLAGRSVMILGHQKGRDTKTNVYRNFGMPNPEGYRKAYRLMKLAEKFNLPVICFLDTPGAYPGIEAEERGQAEAIARNLVLMAGLRVPIVVCIVGEGASGGALGIGVGDRILMLENAWYSVIAPESCSSILWRSWDFKETAAEALKLTATDLSEVGIVDRIVPEPIGGAHRNPQAMFEEVQKVLSETLDELAALTPDELVVKRRTKFYAMGVWTE
ncbi:MAG: acetyl-CoA carboxylase carboxyltransferase subunit alpha [Chlorobi bacterium]|nr:MAG: acetyl-CoA carboxylase carboxyltransferase subunit alpha [Bacteroidota bacterium]KXK35186.1 MAG: Acetyl-CoA carboxylase, alpha subunit [Chlorobi bacterium OLB6]MBL1160504.1 acetyl-CoA carboxylase carboxyltransferase subunit alpha [Chlorobiota bacterium]MBW7853247.1 acetyl-CoA carboxylase carboxyltransferase subunit alpha [Candidatus Kapabacteria bacterium]MCC6331264.1 acetyl-CoA carboxylase carboxyltransferase subunit alpha [Ignavibacteria bacterium]